MEMEGTISLVVTHRAHDLNDLRHRVEAREVAGLLLEVFERNAIGADVLDQVLEALEGPRSETHLLPASS